MPAPRIPDSFLGRFREQDTPVLRAIVKDDAIPPVVIPGSSLSTMTLTLYNEHTSAIVNGRDHVDIKPNVDGAGQLVFPLLVADMVILDATKKEEYRRALIEWTWSTTKRGSWEAQFIVQNLHRVS
jgi:hypothetical protein